MRAGDFQRAWEINDLDLAQRVAERAPKHEGPRHLQQIWRGEPLRDARVLVHCEYGIGRSALLALCVLAATGVPPLEALSRLKQARWKVSPSPEQLEGFREWVRRHGGNVPPLQALFDIAYAHLRGGQVGTGTAA